MLSHRGLWAHTHVFIDGVLDRLNHFSRQVITECRFQFAEQRHVFDIKLISTLQPAEQKLNHPVSRYVS